MLWIGLVLKSALGDAHDPVKDSDFVVTSTADPKAPARCQLKMLGQFGFVPINVGITT